MQKNASVKLSVYKKNNISDTTIDRSMIKSAMAAPYLEKEEEYNLAIRWQRDKDEDALHKITASHMRLVIAIAAKFKRFNLPMGDLIQEGYIGLLEAAARFDPEREVRFSTYATWWIRASIQDYILRNWSIVRGGTSSAQKALFFNLRRLRNQLMQEDENITKDVVYEKISNKIGVSVSDVETMDFRLSGSDNSLSALINSDEDSSTTRMDFLVDTRPLPDLIIEDTLDGEKRDKWLYKALEVLNDRELQIIKERRLDDDGVTLESLGVTLGISKERVRQIESRALQKLREALLSYAENINYHL
ncbi:RNA polymerase factor sigma-32 [Bartonella sp. DGB1]|uniref:RNA polymerase factor sigma-32 n=1 Tax=Bartonella sp. DGB1 TaxID=3239807 RepID=UPI003524910B